MGRGVGLAVGISGAEGGVAGALQGGLAGLASGAGFNVPGAVIGAAVGAALGSGFAAISAALARQPTTSFSPDRNAVTPGSLRERCLPVAFGRCRAHNPVVIDVGAWWWRTPYINVNTGPNVRIMNAMFALCEGPIQFAGNYRVEGRPLELLAGAESTASGGSDTGAPCKVARVTLFNGTATQGLSPRLLDAAPAMIGAPVLTHAGGGSIPSGTYSIAYAFYGGGTESFPSVLSTSANVTVGSGSTITVTAPTLPAGATGLDIYVLNGLGSDWNGPITGRVGSGVGQSVTLTSLSVQTKYSLPGNVNTIDYPNGNRYGYTDYSNDPNANTAIPFRNTAYLDCTMYSDTVYAAPRLSNITADIVGADLTIRRQGTALDGPSPSDVCGYAFYDSGYTGDPDTDAFYCTLTSSTATSPPFGLVRYGRQGSARVHQPPPASVSSSITFAAYFGKHDVLIFQDPSSLQFHVGYWGISPTSSDWQRQLPSSDYSHPILAFCIDEAHSSIHTLHDDGTVRFVLRWNVLTGSVTRLNTDLPSASFKALLYSADISRYVVARDSANVHLIDPNDGTTVNLITSMTTSACVGVCVTGQQVGVFAPGNLFYCDIYTGQVTGPLGTSAPGILTGDLGSIVSAHQSTYTGKVTVANAYNGTVLFKQFAVSCVEDIRDVNANGTSGLSGLPNINPNANKYGAPEPNFQESQIIGSQSFPASWSEGQYNPCCQSTNPALSAVEEPAGIMSNVTDWCRDFSWRSYANGSPITAYQLKLLEGNSSLAAAAWAATVDEPGLDSARWGGGMDPSYFHLPSFEAVHSWCVGAMTFLNPADATSLNNPDATSTTRLAERFKFDYFLEQEMPVPSFVGSQVMMACGGYFYSMGGVFCIGIPKPGLLPALSLSERNFVDGSFSALFSANVDGINRIRARYRDCLDEYRVNVVDVQDENSVNVLGRTQLATLSFDGCGRDQSAELLAKSVLDNGTAGRRQVSFKIDYLGYALSPTDGISVSSKQCGMSSVPMRLASIRETDDKVELAAIEFKNTIDALYNDVNQTIQPGEITVGSGSDKNCTNATAPYVNGVGLNTLGLNYFNQGAALPAGTYLVSYLQGSYTNASGGTHYFADGYNICVRSQSTGNVVKLASAPTRPDPSSSFPDGRPGYYTYEDCYAVNSQVPAVSITLVEAGAVFVQAGGSINPHVAPDSPNLTFQLCWPIEADAADISSVSGIQLWLSADSGAYHDLGTTAATNGQTVEQWNDQSGNGNNAVQTTSGNRPKFKTNQINGYPAIAFTAANSNYLDCGKFIACAPTFAIFAVYKINSSSAINTILSAADAANNNLVPYFSDGGGGNDGFTDAPASYRETSPPGAPSGTWVTAQLFYDGTNITTVLNGAVVSQLAFSGTPETLTNHTIIGRRGDFSNWYLDGELAEIIMVNPCPSPTDRATIESALNAKFSIY